MRELLVVILVHRFETVFLLILSENLDRRAGSEFLKSLPHVDLICSVVGHWKEVIEEILFGYQRTSKTENFSSRMPLGSKLERLLKN
jgi:hypothetical protein